MATNTMDRDLYLQVVAMSADAAKAFAGLDAEPIDLGPADPKRYKDGARVWGFPRTPQNASEKAAIKWKVQPSRGAGVA